MKPYERGWVALPHDVAPRVGAWIETTNTPYKRISNLVVPYAGTQLNGKMASVSRGENVALRPHERNFALPRGKIFLSWERKKDLINPGFQKASDRLLIENFGIFKHQTFENFGIF